MNKGMNTRFLTVAEFGFQTRKSLRAVYAGIKTGRYPFLRVGHTWLIPVAYLDKLEAEALRSVAPGGDGSAAA